MAACGAQRSGGAHEDLSTLRKSGNGSGLQLAGTGEESSPWCIACRLNRTVPSLNSREDGTLWRRVEAAKRRVISALVGLGLPVTSRVSEDPERGLAFDFLRSPANGPRV